MRIEIHAKKIAVDDSLRADIERRLSVAIGRFDEFVGRVTVHLAASNGAGHAGHKQCRICVSLKSWGDVEVEESAADLSTVTARATNRLGLAVVGELLRQRESKRNYRASEE